jgi:hypothetical protein
MLDKDAVFGGTSVYVNGDTKSPWGVGGNKCVYFPRVVGVYLQL